MRTICKIVTGIYVLLCVGALAIIPLNSANLFGEPDPLTGVFAIILAMPWIQILSNLMGDTSGNLSASFALAGIGMGLNAAILWYGCKWLTTGKIMPDDN